MTPQSNNSSRGGAVMLNTRQGHQAVEEAASLNDHINLYGFWR